MVVRSFRNDDLPHLHRLWCEHWERLGERSSTSQRQVEQAILARLFFDPNSLLVAEAVSRPIAWCQWFARGNQIACDETHSLKNGDWEITVPYFCLGSDVSESTGDELVATLLNAIASQQPERLSGKRVQVGVNMDLEYGYCGLHPAGPGFGVTETDHLLEEALTKTGMSPTNRLFQMTAPARGYRIPTNRETLHYRRSNRVQYRVAPSATVSDASALAHLDCKCIALLQNNGVEECSLNFFLSDPEAEAMAPNRCIIDLAFTEGREEMSAAERFLIGNLLQDAASHQVTHVDIVVDASQQSLLGQLEGLGFSRTAAGKLWAGTLL